MKLLFLDIDGVVNSERFNKERNEMEEYKELSYPFDSFDFRAIELVNYILDNTDAKLVISSDWRFDEDLVPCLKYHKLRYDVFGITPFDKHARRGYEIQKYMLSLKCNIENYCIIDDNVYNMIPTQYGNIVQTTYENGLTKELADKAIEILNGNGNKN